MNAIKERVLLDVNNSLQNYNWAEHKDLASFCVCGEYFGDWEDYNNGIKPDFDEVLAIVDKDWLYKYIQEQGYLDDNQTVLDYLQNEYTSDDSINWFDEANRTGHLAMVSFN